jgi:hypothetical protein
LRSCLLKLWLFSKRSCLTLDKASKALRLRQRLHCLNGLCCELSVIGRLVKRLNATYSHHSPQSSAEILA